MLIKKIKLYKNLNIVFFLPEVLNKHETKRKRQIMAFMVVKKLVCLQFEDCQDVI